MSGPLAVRLALAATGLTAAFVVGCGGGGSTTTVIDRTVTETTSEAGPTSETTVPAKSEATTRVVHLTTFQSPSGNIGCLIFSGSARCDIVKRSWSPPPRPASCPSQVDFGQGLEVGRSGTGRFVCAGDTTREPGAPELPYGTASRAGVITCISRASGLTCTNSGGHGFFISIQGYRVF